eukprot:m.211382 g.211382  ORF g.211382 m.211382 type:complete len:499 (+) comp39759_c0_seq25:712-2208(+)
MPSNLSFEAQDLIASMLQKDPRKRISLAAVLDHPFLKQAQLPKKSHSLNFLNDSGLATITTTPTTTATQLRKSLQPMTTLQSLSNVSPSFPIQVTKASSWACPPRERKAKAVTRTKAKTLFEVCPPLSTARLRPTRHRKPNLIMSITPEGDVCLEKLRSHHRGEEYVEEVFRVSGDGQKIGISRPEPCVKADDQPLLQEPDVEFQYKQLETKYWGKYVYLARYVKLVQSKTTKLYYYSERAKGCLMENGNFEACFYDGAKVCLSPSRIHVIQSNGKQQTFEKEEAILKSGREEMQDLYRHAKECHEESLKIEVGMDAVVLPSHRRFQVIVDTREPTENKRGFLSPSEISTRQPSLHSSTLTDMTRTTRSDPTRLRTATPLTSRPYSPSHQRVPVASRPKKALSYPTRSPSPSAKSVSVPGIGKGSQLENRDILVEFNDRTELQVHSTLKNFMYTDNKKNKTWYDMTSSMIPSSVKKKLACLRTVVQQLQTTSLDTRPP